MISQHWNREQKSRIEVGDIMHGNFCPEHGYRHYWANNDPSTQSVQTLMSK